jgi:subtilisin family serine protease
MPWPPLLIRYRAGLLRGLVLLLAGLLLFGAEVGPPDVRGLGPPAAEEATPETLVPAPPYSAAWLRARHLARLGVDRWHGAGYRGQGVKIAVLDSGFRGYRAFLGSTLPARVRVRSFRDDGDLEARDSQHGILCAEVLHALAPDAELLLANWEPDQPVKFLEAVRWARDQGARVVSCSLIMPSWSDGEGGGEVNAAIARLVGSGQAPGDLLCFASAGNTAQRHWCGPLCRGRDGFHEWRPGQCDNRLTPWGNDRVSVELYGPPGVPYELHVRDASTGALVGQATARPGLLGQAPAACATVRFQPTPRRSYLVRVRSESAAAPGKRDKFHVAVLGGYLAWTTPNGSIPCPADGPGVLAVGAVDDGGRRLFYSSCGPNSRRPKPDFVAPVPFPSLWRAQPFAGTSAAAPQAAGLAAVWWSRHPEWTAAQVRDAMRTSARDLGPPGHDWETGYGLVTLP